MNPGSERSRLEDQVEELVLCPEDKVEHQRSEAGDVARSRLFWKDHSGHSMEREGAWETTGGEA